MLEKRLVQQVAKETLLCALKGIPTFGKAVQVWRGIAAQRERLANRAQISSLEERMTRLERDERRQVQRLMGGLLSELELQQAPEALAKSLQDFRQMQQGGYFVGLFEKLLERSPHYPEIQKNPQVYGRLLAPGEALGANAMPVFVVVDAQPRVLEITLFTLQTLLQTPTQGALRAAGEGVWGLPAAQPAQPPAPELPAPRPSSSLWGLLGRKSARRAALTAEDCIQQHRALHRSVGGLVYLRNQLCNQLLAAPPGEERHRTLTQELRVVVGKAREVRQRLCAFQQLLNQPLPPSFSRGVWWQLKDQAATDLQLLEDVIQSVRAQRAPQ